jgi:hypothetical protein
LEIRAVRIVATISHRPILAAKLSVEGANGASFSAWFNVGTFLIDFGSPTRSNNCVLVRPPV